MERSVLLRHLRAVHFASGDRDLARSDARRIARFLGRCGARKVVGIGSAFDPRRPFTDRSDIDLVVEGIDPGSFFSVSARAATLTDFRLDLIPAESAAPALLRAAAERGVEP